MNTDFHNWKKLRENEEVGDIDPIFASRIQA